MRPTIHETMMKIAYAMSERSTCSRRQVGCVLASAKGEILSVGFNGVPRGYPHCTDYPCLGAESKSGTDLDACSATHAEINAIIQCRSIAEIWTCYSTSSPCVQCVKALLNTGCSHVVFAEQYPHPLAFRMWKSVKGTQGWCQFQQPDAVLQAHKGRGDGLHPAAVDSK